MKSHGKSKAVLTAVIFEVNLLQSSRFGEMLKNAQDTKLADFMRESFESIDEDAPAVQLVKLFIVSKAKQVIVTNAGRFSGVVKMDSVIRDLFWA